MLVTTRNWPILALILICSIFTSQCANVKQLHEVQHTDADAFILSVANSTFGTNAFSSINFRKSVIIDNTKIEGSAVSDIYIDPSNRIWISYLNPIIGSNKNIEIYSIKGEKEASFQVCDQPRAGVQFTDKYAFVVCAQDGFSGRVTVVNLADLTVKKNLVIESDNGVLLLVASAINNKNLLLTGLTTGPDEKSTYTLLTLINTETMEVESQIGPLAGIDVWSILPYKDKFILLNVASWSQSESNREDAILLTPGDKTQLKPLIFASSPLWGVIDGDNLFAYHNPTWNQLNSASNRLISKFDLLTGKFLTWALPDNWYAEDIDIIAGNLILTSWDPVDTSRDGIYSFDLNNQKLEQIFQISSASKISRISNREK